MEICQNITQIECYTWALLSQTDVTGPESRTEYIIFAFQLNVPSFASNWNKSSRLGSAAKSLKKPHWIFFLRKFYFFRKIVTSQRNFFFSFQWLYSVDRNALCTYNVFSFSFISSFSSMRQQAFSPNICLPFTQFAKSFAKEFSIFGQIFAMCQFILTKA